MPDPRTVIAPPPQSADTRVASATDPAGGPIAGFPEQVGRFRLLWELARGGMGVVFRAVDTDLNRVVAVKLVKGVNDPAAKLRFLEEAKVTAQLQHPGVPPVYEAGELPDGRPFLAMKLIKGRTLADLLASRERPEVGHLVGVFEQICQTVGYAHANRVIHRDLKPANVMVGAFGEVQVMDWGLARTGEREEQKQAAPTAFTDTAGFRTVVGSVVGTPAFCAPEQARGELEVVGERSDVFGLGAILCVVLTGSPPFYAADATTALARAAAADLTEAFTRLDGCEADPELIALCKRCLTANPADRPADGGAVADEVARFRAAADERAKAAELERAKADTRAAAGRVRQRITLVAAGVLLLVGLLALWQWVRAEGEGERAKGEQKKAEDALGQVQVEQGKTKDALDAKTEEQKKTAAALAEVQAGRRRSLAALRQLTAQVVVNPFLARQATQPLAVRGKVADLWGEFAADPDPEVAAEAGVWAAALRWDETKPEATVTVMSAALKAVDALPTAKSAEVQRAAAFGPGYVGFARTRGGTLTDANAGAPDEYRTAVSRLRRLAADAPAEYAEWLAEALAAVAHHDRLKVLKGDAEAREVLTFRRERAKAAPTDPAALTALNAAYALLFDVWGSLPLFWPADAEPLLRESVAEEERQVGLHGKMNGVPFEYGALGKAHRRLGGWLRLHGKLADGETELRAAVDDYDAILKTFPGLTSVQLDRAAALTDLGECLTAAGKGKEAVEVLGRCRKETEALAEAWKAVPPAARAGFGVDPGLELTDTLAFLAAAQAAAGDAEKARDTAADCRKRFAAFDANTPNYAATAPRVFGQLALAEIALRLADKDSAAVPLLVEKFDADVTKRFAGPDAGPLRWELAKKLVEAKEPTKAVGQLAAVIDAGFTNRDLLIATFPALKDRDDFKALLTRLPEPKK